MQVFSWHGTIDTVMTPYDSIRYYKELSTYRYPLHGTTNRAYQSLGRRYRL